MLCPASLYNQYNSSRNVRKCTFGHVHPVMVQISLRIWASHAVWSESQLNAFWIAKDTKFLHAQNEDTGQTAWMRWLIRIFVGRTCQKVRFVTLLFICCCWKNVFWAHADSEWSDQPECLCSLIKVFAICLILYNISVNNKKRWSFSSASLAYLRR